MKSYTSGEKFTENVDKDSRNKKREKIEVLYEDERILVINKKPGISHHNERAYDEIDDLSANEVTVEDDEDLNGLGIVSVLRRQLSSENEHENKPTSIYGVHRLDKVTSGILLFAKDSKMASQLSLAFRHDSTTNTVESDAATASSSSKRNKTKRGNKIIQKYYIALSEKKPKKKKQGWIQGEMVKSRRGTWKLTNSNSGSTTGKKKKNFAKTRFFSSGLGQINEIFLSKYKEKQGTKRLPKTLMLFEPISGKKHQIRVAAKSLGIPILGDEKYESSTSSQELDNGGKGFIRADRTYLHACAMHIDMAALHSLSSTYYDDEDDENDNNNAPESLTIISKPESFGELVWDDDDECKHLFSEIVDRIVENNCVCQPIVNKWLQS